MERLSKQGKSLKNFTYNDKETADEIYSAINSTQFIGVSVSILYTHCNKKRNTKLESGSVTAARAYRNIQRH